MRILAKLRNKIVGQNATGLRIRKVVSLATKHPRYFVEVRIWGLWFDIRHTSDLGHACVVCRAYRRLCGGFNFNSLTRV